MLSVHYFIEKFHINEGRYVANLEVKDCQRDIVDFPEYTFNLVDSKDILGLLMPDSDYSPYRAIPIIPYRAIPILSLELKYYIDAEELNEQIQYITKEDLLNYKHWDTPFLDTDENIYLTPRNLVLGWKEYNRLFETIKKDEIRFVFYIC